VEVSPENKTAFEAVMSGVATACIGQVNNTDTLKIYGVNGPPVVSVPISELKEAWQKPLRW
jgi:phosphoribosylformylglycinamidine synthase